MIKTLKESQLSNRTWIPYGRLISEILHQGGILRALSDTQVFTDKHLGTEDYKKLDIRRITRKEDYKKLDLRSNQSKHSETYEVDQKGGLQEAGYGFEGICNDNQSYGRFSSNLQTKSI